jgi:hypothetical protein
MAPHPRAARRVPRSLVISVVAILLFGWVFLYRFNTLGGAYGGFDNDHFLYLAAAKQVEAGEQPLRDFQDGMHGAWPSLTYELSAAAQRYVGDHLRAEALLTVIGVALGTAIGFVAGAMVAPWPWALSTAVLAAWLAPKLYGYPKVLVMAIAAWLIVGTRGLPTWRRTSAMAVLTAAAFLFRHDYAVYCALAIAVVLLLSGRVTWRERLMRGVGYVVMTSILLAPSLWWIHRYRGVTEYVRNAMEMSRAEYERTLIGWPAFSSDGVRSWLTWFDTDTNAEVWIYYLFLALPVLVGGLALWQVLRGDERDRAVTIVALSVMTAALWYSFLRGNLAARFGDMGPPVAIIGAWLLSTMLRPSPSPRLLVKAVSALAVMYVTVSCVWRIGSVSGELRSSRLLEPQDVIARFRQNSADLAAMPRSLRESESAGRMQASDYLYRCTKPSDRVIAIGYYADVPVFSERLFAGGRSSFVVAFYLDPLYTREIVAKLQSQSVPIVLAGPNLDHERYRPIADYVHAHYDNHGEVSSSQGPLRVWTRRELKGVPSGPNGLPCFA